MFITAIAMALISQTASASPVWHLGTTLLGRRDDTRQDLFLPPCGTESSNHAVQYLKLVVSNEPATIERLVAIYGDGTRQELRVNEYRPEGSQTRWIDLVGNERKCVRRLVIVGESEGQRAARIDVYGYRNN